MTEFKKRTDITLLVISLITIIASAVIIAMSDKLLYFIQDVLQDKVFHRTFRLEKWADTINSLLAFPIFIVIFLDTVFFVKFSKLSKAVLLGTFFAVTAFFITWCNFAGDTFMTNSDLASEILLAKECFLNKTFWPLTWHYSTEFRLLNTQIITAPLFFITKNLHSIKAISGILVSLLLPLSLWFILVQLKIKSVWTKLVSCLLIFCPWSMLSWDFIQYGNYYIPHVAMSFFYTGLFFAIVFNDLSSKKKKTFTVIFAVLSLICGMSSIRYILQFQFPLALVTLSLAVNVMVKTNSKFSIKKFFFENKAVFYSCLGLALGLLGYIFNVLVLSSLYSFSNYNTLKFNEFNEITVMHWLFDILSELGYKNSVSVLTPSGAVNVFVYVIIVFFILNTVDFLKAKTASQSKYIFVLYSIVMFVFNAFVFINTDYYARYLLILLLCIFPCMAIFAEEHSLSIIKRSVLSVSAVCVLLTSSFVCYSTVLSHNENTDKAAVTQFLDKQGYTLGYGTFWNANVFTQLTDGKIEMCNIRYEDDPWLTTSRYYAPDYKAGQKTFIILSQKEIDSDPKLNSIQIGTKVYSDKYYTVYEYQDKALVQKELHSPVFEDFIDAKTIK